jgi:hypothetical protein
LWSRQRITLHLARESLFADSTEFGDALGLAEPAQTDLTPPPMAGLGHEDQFPRPSLSGGFRFG